MRGFGKLFGKILPVVLALLLSCAVAICAAGCNDRRGNAGDGQNKIEYPSDDGDDNQTPDDGDNQTPDDGDDLVFPSDWADSGLWAQNHTLPDADAALEKLSDIYGGADKVFLLYGNTVYRMTCPEDGEYININCMFTPEDYIRPVIEDCVAEFNYAFDVINPNYKFKLNFNPTGNEQNSRYKITVTAVDNFGSSTDTLGMASPYDNSIRIREDVFNDGKKTMSVFKHELMHLFGAGDAYTSDKYTKDTIMQRYQFNGPFSFSATDIALIDTLYRNPDNRYPEKYVNAFVARYTEINPHTYEYNRNAALLKVMRDVDVSAVKTAVAELYADDDADAVINYLDEGEWSFNRDFGSVNVSFSDLTLREYDSETVLYSGRFNVADKKYTHTTQKYGANMSSGMSITYTDYGNGILFAAPNGTAGETYFVQSGDYVFAFECLGGFTDLKNYKMVLRRVNIIK